LAPVELFSCSRALSEVRRQPMHISVDEREEDMERLDLTHQGTLLKASAIAAAALLGIGIAGAPARAFAFTTQQFANQAKVSLKEARQIAENTFHGKVVSEELEKEKGGSGLRYSFDIRRGNVTQEVGVDAITGKVIEDSREGPNAD
jgi:uncharacterized membrane protein YkoI